MASRAPDDALTQAGIDRFERDRTVVSRVVLRIVWPYTVIDRSEEICVITGHRPSESVKLAHP